MSATRIGDYTVIRELGRGGMGQVFQGLSPRGATVAIKTMLLAEGLNPRARWETVERFQREARAARSLVHPEIVQVLDIGADQDTFFIVMEFLDGHSLRELLSSAGALRVERAVEIVTAACAALSYAHAQGIVHRDIKPENIMVLRNGSVKLMDFGLASIVSEQGVTQTGTVMGTLSYMSPEQARGEALDARSDFFSLGATCYEMLAGRPAFQGETPAATLHAILTEEPAPIVGLPGALARVLTKCLRKQPQYRFTNAAEIAAGLAATEGRAEPAGTAILPGRPAAPAPAATVAPDVAASLTSPPPAFRCSQCREPMSRTAAVCWRCGAPNSLISMRTQQAKRQQEVDNILHGLAPPSDRGGRGRKRR